MRPLPVIRLCLLCIGALAIFTGPRTTLASQDGQLCIAAARRAAMAHGVPPDVLIALSLTETATRRDGALQPWPWAVNDGGPSHWFDTRDDALAFAYGRYRTGARNFDIGCFQLNFHWHGSAFDSLSDMFDPDLNADYAARFLKSHYAETGDWTAAAGRYHSQTEAHAHRYRAAFADNRDRVQNGKLGPAQAAPGITTIGGWAALQVPSGVSSAGSLVALGFSARPMLVQGRSLLQ